MAAIVVVQHICHGSPHHGGPHYPSSRSSRQMRPEHRGMLAEDTFQSRMGVEWPNSKSHWEGLPFHSKDLNKWHEKKPSASAAALPDDRFDIRDEFNPSAIHGKRHAIPSHDFFHKDHAEFERPEPFAPSPSFHPKTHFPEASGHHGFDYQVNYEERPKRHHFLPQGPSSESRFSPPTFEQFRPTDFKSHNAPPSPPSQSRPIRHTSFPASFQDGHDEGHLGASNKSPDFGFKPFGSGNGKSHSYTTFEAPKVNSNVFIDHSDEDEVNRPVRASPPFSRPQAPSSSSPSFQPTQGNFLPQEIQANIEGHFKNRQSFSAPSDVRNNQPRPPIPSYPSSDNVDVYDYLEEEIDHLNNLGDSFKFEKSRGGPPPSHNNAVDDINGSPDYNYPSPDYEYNNPEASPASQGSHEPFEYRDRGRHQDERYDRENREESGKYDVRNYREPIQPMKYERDEPLEVNHYGDSFGSVKTFKGGYDSEEDAARGIQRHFKPTYDQDDEPEIYIEGEPLHDYNRDGYYVPKERSHQAMEQTYQEDMDEEPETENPYREGDEEGWRGPSQQYYGNPSENEREAEGRDQDQENPPQRPRRRHHKSLMMKQRPMKEDFARASSRLQSFWTPLNY